MILQTVVSGLAAGGVYALLAVGLVLVFRASGVVNFAHGAVAMLAIFIALELHGRGAPAGVAVAGAVAGAFGFGVAVSRFAMRPARRGGHATEILATVALLVLIEGLAGLVWGTDLRPFPLSVEGPVRVAGVVVPAQDVAITGAAVLLASALGVLSRRTRTGLALRAAADDRAAAELMGVSLARTEAVAWGLGSALAAAAGLLLAPRVFVEPSMMSGPLVKAFAAAVLGGLSSVPAAVLGGWLLGLTETLVGAYVSTELADALAFVLLVAVLAVRPAGLLRGGR